MLDILKTICAISDGGKYFAERGYGMKKNKTRKVAFLGLLFALAIALSYLESLIPSFVAVPGIKLGLSNTVVMYCLFFVGPLPALVIAVLKAVFVLITRGFAAGMLSAAGGMCSAGVMILLNKLKSSKGAISVAGAVTHNVGQLAVAWLILSSPAVLYYAPVLILSGVVMGIVTAVVLKLVLPALSRINKYE